MAIRYSLIVLFVFLLPITALSATKYTVKKGDNLYDLASKFGVSVEDLKSVNNLEDNRLDIGDVLIVPNSGGTAKSREDGSNNKEYTVKKGDTLGGIAGRHGVSAAALQNENGLSSTKLQIGQKLVIPSGQTPSVKSARTRQTTDEVSSEPVKSAASAIPATYTVRNGDTLGHIAAKFGMSSREFRAENGLKSDKLSIGQTLKIPGGATAAKSPEVTATAAEAKTPEAPKHTAPAGGTYIVEKGDTPGRIAEKLGVSTEDLIKLNNINSKSLQIGRKLVIPGRSGAVTAAADTAPVPVKAENTEAEKPASEPEKTSPTEITYYTVAKGDTPGGIAQKLGVSTKDLVELNSIDSKNLRIGQKLVVPGSVKPVETVKASETVTEAQKPTASSADSAPEIPDVYTVRKGDTLGKIGGKFGVSVSELKKMNSLRSDNLRVGQKLALTSVATAESATETEDPAVTAKFSGSYKVGKGDTLGQLALRHGVSQNELKNANGLKNSNIRIGQVLKVPGPVKKDVVVVAEPAAPVAEPVQAQPQETASSSEVYIKKRYVVKEGDTLGGIASSFGVTVDEIKKASALKSDNIGKGNILLIPVPQERVTSSRYTVAKGDTLGKISRKFGVSVKELKDANGLRSNTLRAGTKLSIPGITQSPSEPALEVGTKVVATASPRREHVVAKGDTLGSIAGKYDTTITSIKNENKIEGNTISAGQVLVIPTIPGQETAYVAVADKSTIQSNGSARAASESGEVKNGRFSKESIIAVAKKYLGTPYKFGGNDLITGIDCSGYVKKVFSRFNVNLPRTARDIYYRSGESVKKAELDTGDLVFFTTYAKFPSHVGIYIGNDEFIHASSASRKVTIDSINKQYYRKRYIGAKRVQLSGLFYDEMSRGYGGFEKN